jgi:uncharacterized membrane protein
MAEMTVVEMAVAEIPLVINVVVAIGIAVLTILMLYFAVMVAPKQMDLGEKEEAVLYGKSTKPLHGSYRQIYRSFDRSFHRGK